jgi:hypothetical protein
MLDWIVQGVDRIFIYLFPILIMKKLIFNVLKFSVAVLILFFGFLYFYLKKFEPYIDSNYARLTKLHNEGLVIGTSRAAIDIEPSFLKQNLYNFSFTIDATPFDNSYRDLIKKYHQTQKYDSNRIHLVTVDPWALSSVIGKEKLINDGFTSKLNLSIMDPNWEYIFKFANLSIWEINNVSMNTNRNLFVNSTGRLVKPMTEAFLNKDFDRKIKVKLENYRNGDLYNSGSISEGKLSNLRAIIDYLKKDGKVYLIRLPVTNQMLELENKLSPDFNQRMFDVSKLYSIPYIDFMPYNHLFRTSDGHHLWDGEIKKFNLLLAEKLKLNQTND